MIELTSSSSDVLLNPGAIIKDRWEIIKKIGGGGFGEIYSAKDMVTNNKIAVKLERTEQFKLVLKMEIAVLKKLQGTVHACKLYGCGKNDRFNYIVMSLQGKTLNELRKSLRKGVFSISTTIILGQQILNCLKELHEVGFLHRDIKPSNFAMGRLRSTYRIVYMLDFGLSRRFIDKEGNLRSPRSSAGFRGTVKYASSNAHKNRELGRHDDLYSLIYMLVEMISGQLPWRKFKEKEEVGFLKQTVDPYALLQNMPHEFMKIYQYVQNLTYFDKPNYDKIDTIFNNIMKRREIDKNEPFDWEGAIILDPISNNGNVVNVVNEKIKTKDMNTEIFDKNSYFSDEKIEISAYQKNTRKKSNDILSQN